MGVLFCKGCACVCVCVCVCVFVCKGGMGWGQGEGGVGRRLGVNALRDASTASALRVTCHPAVKCLFAICF